MGKSAPKAPDPAIAIDAQASANKEAAVDQANLNRLDEITPYGTVTYGSSLDQDAYNQALSDYQAAVQAEEEKFAQVPPHLRPKSTIERPRFDDPRFNKYNRTTEFNPTAQETFEEQQALGLSLSQLANEQTGRIEGTLVS